MKRNVVIRFLTEGHPKVNAALKKIQDNYKRLEKISKQTSKNMTGATTTTQKRVRGQWKEQERQIENVNTGLVRNRRELINQRWVAGRWVDVNRKVTQSATRFRMELLGVLFFGMAVQRMFSGLMRPALQAAGVFDIWRSILEILFLPIALDVTEALVKILEKVSKMPESTKKAIGVIALLGFVFGTLLLIIGTVGLGISSLAMFFANFGLQLLIIISALGVFITLLAAIGGGAEAVDKLWGGISKISDGLLGAMKTTSKAFFDASGEVNSYMDDLKTGYNAAIELTDKNKNSTDNLADTFDTLHSKTKKTFNDANNSANTLEKNLGDVGTSGKISIDNIKNSTDNLDTTTKNLNTTVKNLNNNMSNMTINNEIADDISTIADGFEDVASALGDVKKGWNDLASLWGITDWIARRGESIGDLFESGGFLNPISWGKRLTSYFEIGSSYDDFIMRPGSGAVSFSPEDTVIGIKEPGNLGKTINFSPTININASISNDTDIRQLGNKLSDMWKDDLATI
jgi:methyl-accepting chemotaxis protein